MNGDDCSEENDPYSKYMVDDNILGTFLRGARTNKYEVSHFVFKIIVDHPDSEDIVWFTEIYS